MQYRSQVIALLEQALTKLGEVQPKGSTSTNRLREGKEKVRAAKAKVAEETEEALPPPPPPPPPPLTNQIYVGAWIVQGHNEGTVPWNESYWTKFEELSGAKMGIIHFGMKWGEWSAPLLSKVAAKGAIPCVDLSYGSLTEVLEGKGDIGLAQMRKEIETYGKPIFIRPFWEANGSWFSWGQKFNYVEAWRYVHSKLNLPNVSWVYCPNTVYDSTTEGYLKSMYPGDEYVDWVGFDGYNTGTNPYKGDRWKTPAEVYDKTYNLLRTLAPNKPIMVGETGSTEYGGSKATWINELLKVLPERYPQIKCLLYFNWEINENGGWIDWPVTTSSSAQTAWKMGLTNYYRKTPNATATGQKPLVP